MKRETQIGTIRLAGVLEGTRVTGKTTGKVMDVSRHGTSPANRVATPLRASGGILIGTLGYVPADVVEKTCAELRALIETKR